MILLAVVFYLWLGQSSILHNVFLWFLSATRGYLFLFHSSTFKTYCRLFYPFGPSECSWLCLCLSLFPFYKKPQIKILNYLTLTHLKHWQICLLLCKQNEQIVFFGSVIHAEMQWNMVEKISRNNPQILLFLSYSVLEKFYLPIILIILKTTLH